MRWFLTIVSFLFITQSCFAINPTDKIKQADKKVACNTAAKKRISLLHRLFNKINPDEDNSNVSRDYFEHPTLIRQDLKKTFVPYTLLFHTKEYKQQPPATFKIYTANPRLNYNFIYQCLYPKHVFW